MDINALMCVMLVIFGIALCTVLHTFCNILSLHLLENKSKKQHLHLMRNNALKYFYVACKQFTNTMKTIKKQDINQNRKKS